MNVTNIGNGNGVKPSETHITHTPLYPPEEIESELPNLTGIDPSEKPAEAPEEDTPLPSSTDSFGNPRRKAGELTLHEKQAFVSFIINFHQIFGPMKYDLTAQNLTWLSAKHLPILEEMETIVKQVQVELSRQLEQISELIEAYLDPDDYFYRVLPF